MAEATQTRIFDGKKWTTKMIEHAAVNVLGQTSGEWILLGEFALPKGDKACVEISNKNANGTVVADAVLFVPVNK
ncbi:MAG TPA: hypothetical protein VL307_16120 [Chitinophagaceae bacterium]|nr:hypothetical protein [Chitinophagaceae bacterium]